MSPALRKGLLVAALHVAIVASLGAKLVIDRATRPRVWARAAPVDPNLPIRGRYVSLRLEAAIGEGLDLPVRRTGVSIPIALSVQDQQLVALPSSGSSVVYARAVQRDGHPVAELDQPIAYFMPEHVADPSRRATGEELWVEVTIPRRGAPRPIRLGVKKDGMLMPLEVK
jgi:hypothetical protein